MKLKIELSRQGNFILALLLIHFVFFGVICLIYPENVGTKLLFLYQALFLPKSIISFLILVSIIFIMVVRENFFEYAIKNSIWLIPAILMMSWFWYWFIFGFDITIVYIYFIRIEGVFTILSLLCINLLAAILASSVKERRKLEKKALLKEAIIDTKSKLRS